MLKLQSVADAGEELDGGAFGGLAARRAARLRGGPARDSTDAGGDPRGAVHRAWTVGSPNATAAVPPSSVRVQVEQLRARLSAFADQQAAWAASRLADRKTEVSARKAAGRLRRGRPAVLSARPDRPDRLPSARRTSGSSGLQVLGRGQDAGAGPPAERRVGGSAIAPVPAPAAAAWASPARSGSATSCCPRTRRAFSSARPSGRAEDLACRRRRRPRRDPPASARAVLAARRCLRPISPRSSPPSARTACSRKTTEIGERRALAR